MNIPNLPDHCCGCEMCLFLCPTTAISFSENEYGFRVPVIDDSLCIKCGTCVKNCKMKNPTEGYLPQKVLAVKHKNMDVVLNSSSGGFFYALAEWFVHNNGVVYGAVYNWNDSSVEHTCLNNENDIHRAMGSKYVQSIKIPYDDIENNIKHNKRVLFTGCPCQVDSCISFLKKKGADLNLLTTCDFVCHGVPSPRVWRDYVDYLKSKYKGDVTNYSFRYKSEKCKWGSVNASAVINEKRLTNTPLIKSFLEEYFGGFITREDCLKCPYASKKRKSDLTMADCWGIEKVNRNFNDRNGVSLVLINSEKGCQTFDAIQNQLDYEDVDLDKLDQPHLYNPAIANNNKNAFWDCYKKNGYKTTAKKYTRFGVLNHLKYGSLKVKNAILSKMIKILKRSN